MARSIWKGSLAFGLVNIPIELYSATREHRPKFRLLHAKDEAPVRYERVCQRDGKAVGWEDLVKGYEYEKGRFVVITKDDFKTAALEKTKTIDVLDFVNPDEIDERYFETPYYLQAGKGADRAYALLREAIRESGQIGIAKIISPRRAAPRRRRGNRRRDRPDDDAVCRRARRPGRLPLSQGGGDPPR
jgi:DNA end-binding protein Ku